MRKGLVLDHELTEGLRRITFLRCHLCLYVEKGTWSPPSLSRVSAGKRAHGAVPPALEHGWI